MKIHADAIPNIKSECAKQVQAYPTIMSVPVGGGKGREFGEDGHAKHLPSTLSRFSGRGEAKDKAGALAEGRLTDLRDDAGSRGESVPLVVVPVVVPNVVPNVALKSEE